MALAQCQVINKILETKDLSLIEANNLSNSFFPDYSKEFNFILNHKQRYGSVPDKATFVNVFPDFNLMAVDEPDTYLLEQLGNEYKLDCLASGFNKAKNLVETDEQNIDKAADIVRETADKLQLNMGLTCVDYATDSSRYTHYLERAADKGKYYTSTGFPELDQLLGGIDRENENMVICARPGKGKSYVLFKMAAAAYLTGLNVLIYSGEMSVDKVAYRIDTFISHIKNTSLNRGDLYVQAQYNEYINSIKGLSTGSIKIFTPNDVPGGSVSVGTIRAYIEKYKPDIVFLDQYSLIDDNKFAKTDAEHVANIAKDIKHLQVEKRLPIIAASQFNRGKNETGEQDGDNVAGSDKITQYATTMFALEQKEDSESGKIQLVVRFIKVRDGLTGSVKKVVYDMNFNEGIFTYIPVEGDGVATPEDFNKIENSYAVTQKPSNGNIF